MERNNVRFFLSLSSYVTSDVSDPNLVRFSVPRISLLGIFFNLDTSAVLLTL